METNNKIKLKITQDLDYVEGHLRYGHMKLEIDKEEWDKMTKVEQEEYFEDNAEVIIDDYEIDDYDKGQNKLNIEEIE